jgi:chromosome segregation ATPase
MKNFQQNLLIVAALSLCGLCVYQWSVQTTQRNQIGQLNQAVYDKTAAIRGYTNSLSAMDHQISELEAEMTMLRKEAQAKEEQASAQLRQINSLRANQEALTNQITEYKKALAAVESKLKEAYAGIQKQNDALAELVAQRDDFVKKFNDSVNDRNVIVSKYNDLVDRVQKQQTGEKTKP